MVYLGIVKIREERFYIKPVPKVAPTPSFLPSGICRLDNIGSGKTKI